MLKRRLDVFSPDLPLDGLEKDIKVYLSGPCESLDIPQISEITWLNPRENNIQNRYNWETTGMRIADIIIFYVPADLDNPQLFLEIGENLGRKSGKNIIACIDKNYSGRDYLKIKFSAYNYPVFDNWKDTLKEIKRIVKLKSKPKIFFTSDTHFGNERTLKTSKRPFSDIQEMDWRLIELWNSVVSPSDIVYHLGDFGEHWTLDYLNGFIKLIPGNYESELGNPPGIEILPDIYESPEGFKMSHEPLKIKDLPGLKLFGHIHGRQKIKSWGGIDVGVDAWGFKPVPKEEIDSLFDSFKYYDEEVWS